MFELNQKCKLDNQDGTFTDGIFKGYCRNKELCLFKPIDKRNITGYGMTFCCLLKLVKESVDN